MLCCMQANRCRNLQEYRVRKAHHVFVREQDLMKYLAFLVALTITGTGPARQSMPMDTILSRPSRMDRRLSAQQHAMGELLATVLFRDMVLVLATLRTHLSSVWLAVVLQGVPQHVGGTLPVLVGRVFRSLLRHRFQSVEVSALPHLSDIHVRLTNFRYYSMDSWDEDLALIVAVLQLHVTLSVNMLAILIPKIAFVSRQVGQWITHLMGI